MHMISSLATIALLGSMSHAFPHPTEDLVTRAAERSGGFAATCKNLRVNEVNQAWVLYADCGEGGSGGEDTTHIVLGNCLGNEHGNLIYEKGGAFGLSCTAVELKGTVLHAGCATGTGKHKGTSIDLNTVLGNDGGDLIC